MPMIDVYAPAGAFADKSQLALSVAAAGESARYPDVSREHRCVHPRVAHDAISNVDGGADYVRVQVLTNAGALDRDKQIALVERLTALVSGAPGNPAPPARIWVLLTEAAPDGGWGLWGSAHTNDELIAAARSQMAAAAEAAHNGEAPGA